MGSQSVEVPYTDMEQLFPESPCDESGNLSGRYTVLKMSGLTATSWTCDKSLPGLPNDGDRVRGLEGDVLQ